MPVYFHGLILIPASKTRDFISISLCSLLTKHTNAH